MAGSPYANLIGEIVGWAEYSFATRHANRPQGEHVRDKAALGGASARYAPPAAILLQGRSGVGKSRLVAELLAEDSAWWTGVRPQSLIIEGESVYQSATPLSKLNDIFDKIATATSPFVLVIEHLEALCPANGSNTGNANTLEVQILGLVSKWLDVISSAPHAGFILATSSRASSIHPAVRRHGRVGLAVIMTAPTPPQQVLILREILRDTDIEDQGIVDLITEQTTGFLAADLKLLCQEAVMLAVKHIDTADLEDGQNDTKSLTCVLQWWHFKKALENIRPAHLADYPQTLLRSTKSLAGIDQIIDEIMHTAELSLKHPERCVKVGVKPPRGILILGPAGVGKTNLALMVAKSINANILPVLASSVRAKVVGEAEAALTQIFRRARDSQPCILLIDQLDGLAATAPPGQSGGAQSRILSCLTSLLDDCFRQEQLQILVIGTCRTLEAIDKSIYRAGRLDVQIHIPLPNLMSRVAILQQTLQGMPAAKHLVGTAAIESLAKRLDGESGATIDNICREAALLGLRRNLDCERLQLDDLETVVDSVTVGS